MPLQLFLSKPQKAFLKEVSGDLTKQQLKLVTTGFRRKQLGLHRKYFGLSDTIGADVSYPQLILAAQNHDLEDHLEDINESIERGAFDRASARFSKDAFSKITELIVPGVICNPAVKQACALQLFSKERLHILLLGDPDIGRAEIVRSSARLHPISGVQTGATLRNSDALQNALAEASGGIIVIDDMHQLSESQLSAISNAMEKGVISSTHGEEKKRVDTSVCVLGSANPKGERFIGKDLKFLRQQIPFSNTLLSRFHVVFMMRVVTHNDYEKIRSSLEEFAKRQEHSNDIVFVQRYVEEALALDVDFPKSFQQEIADWVTQVAEQQEKLLIEATPRFVVSIVRLAQAHARAHLRKEVVRKDLEMAFDIMEASFKIPVPRIVDVKE